MPIESNTSDITEPSKEPNFITLELWNELCEKFHPSDCDRLVLNENEELYLSFDAKEEEYSLGIIFKRDSTDFDIRYKCSPKDGDFLLTNFNFAQPDNYVTATESGKEAVYYSIDTIKTIFRFPNKISKKDILAVIDDNSKLLFEFINYSEKKGKDFYEFLENARKLDF